MKERPILFSAPMVRAILAGNKTMTRRVVKSRHFPKLERFLGGALDGKWNLIPLPYGQPGDRLWVREAHRLTACTCEEACRGPGQVYYAADCSGYQAVAFERLRPSIHMPRWASRITLEVTGVRVERLQDITSDQILAEGIRIPACAESGNVLIDISTKYGPAHFLGDSWRDRLNDVDALLHAHWAALWVAINGIDSWAANPWVWVVEFKRVETSRG